jgi:hypothetical protein
MSRYLVDKFLYHVDRDAVAFQAYFADPAGFVERWDTTVSAALDRAERMTTLHFTDEERTALATVDYAALYAGGAHPFILWTLMVAREMERGTDVPGFAREYADRVRIHGRPDFRT